MTKDKNCSNCGYWKNQFGCTNVNSEGFHKLIFNSKEAYCDVYKNCDSMREQE